MYICICSAQSENLGNLEIALHILRILRLRTIVVISRLPNYSAQSSDCTNNAHYSWYRRQLANCSTNGWKRQERRRLARQHLSDLLCLLSHEWNRRRAAQHHHHHHTCRQALYLVAWINTTVQVHANHAILRLRMCVTQSQYSENVQILRLHKRIHTCIYVGVLRSNQTSHTPVFWLHYQVQRAE